MLVVLAALIAAAASSPADYSAVSGTSSTFDILLTGAAPGFEQRFTALLDAQVAIGEDGQVGLTAIFGEDDIGQVQLSLVSETTGEPSDSNGAMPTIFDQSKASKIIIFEQSFRARTVLENAHPATKFEVKSWHAYRSGPKALLISATPE